MTAVATRNADSARAAAEAFGARESYDDIYKLVQSEQVDIVTVSVKVPHHLEVVEAALAAKKHILCEWALGSNLDEADRMTQDQAGLTAIILSSPLLHR